MSVRIYKKIKNYSKIPAHQYDDLLDITIDHFPEIWISNDRLIILACIAATKLCKFMAVPGSRPWNKRGWVRTSRPLDKRGGGGRSPKKFFWPFGIQFGLKISWRGERSNGRLPGPLLWIRHCMVTFCDCNTCIISIIIWQSNNLFRVLSSMSLYFYWHVWLHADCMGRVLESSEVSLTFFMMSQLAPKQDITVPLHLSRLKIVSNSRL